MKQCGAWGGCPLPLGHNMGKVDIPENHAPAVAEDVAALAKIIRPWTLCDDGGRFDHGSERAAQAVIDYLKEKTNED